MAKKVIFYRNIDKKCPVEEFIDTLPAKTAQKVTWTLSLVEDREIVPDKYFKLLKNTNIWEFRIHYDKNIYRIFSFFDGNSVVVAAHGFHKKTQKAPKKEIERAEKYRLDYLKRKKENRL
jgi:phage-related protein